MLLLKLVFFLIFILARPTKWRKKRTKHLWNLWNFLKNKNITIILKSNQISYKSLQIYFRVSIQVRFSPSLLRFSFLLHIFSVDYLPTPLQVSSRKKSIVLFTFSFLINSNQKQLNLSYNIFNMTLLCFWNLPCALFIYLRSLDFMLEKLKFFRFSIDFLNFQNSSFICLFLSLKFPSKSIFNCVPLVMRSIWIKLAICL